MNRLTHTDNRGRASMVDVGDKEIMTSVAKAAGHISLEPDTLELGMRGRRRS